MNKVYYYTDQEVGISWPGPDPGRQAWCKLQGIPHPRFVWYDWPGFEETTDPNRADVFVVRHRLIDLTNEIITNLPYYRGDLRYRHVFFGLGPDGGAKAFRNLSHFPGIFFRACVSHSMIKFDPDIIAWPWPVAGVGEYAAIPSGGFKYDAVFQGQVAGFTESTIQSIEQSGLNSCIVRLDRFFPVIRKQDPKRGVQLRTSYLEAMQASRIALCPNGNPMGAIRYRLYEAMSMGRVNLFIGDECVLPLSDKIDWHNCIIQIANRDAHKAGEFLEYWLRRHSDNEIITMGARAREVWDTWLRRENWGKVVGLLVKERLEEI
jgi:hypothetical protein